MGIASEMKELTRNIASSHKDRVKRIDEIRQETSQTREGAKDLIKGFEAARKELKAELKEASVAWQGLTVAKAKTK